MTDMSPATAVALIGVVLVGYQLLLVLLAAAAQPMRERMVDLAEDMLRSDGMSAKQRDQINAMLDSAMSFRVGLLVPFAVAGVIIDALLGRSDKVGELPDTPRIHRFVLLYAVSIIAANPLAAIIHVPLVIGWSVVSKGFRARPAREAVETPLIRAGGAPELRLAA